MKKRVFSLFTTFILFFSSCNFLGISDPLNNKYASLKDNQSLLTVIIGQGDSSRTAVLLPDFSSLYDDITLYKIKVQKSDGTSDIYGCPKTVDGFGEINIPLTKAKYTVTVYGYNTSTSELLTEQNYETIYNVYDFANIDLTNGNRTFKAFPLPKNSGEGKGNFDFTFTFKQKSDTTYTVSVILDTQELEEYKNINLNCSSTYQDLHMQLSNLEVGNHLLSLVITDNLANQTFYKSFSVIIYNNFTTTVGYNSFYDTYYNSYTFDSKGDLNKNRELTNIGFIVYGKNAKHKNDDKTDMLHDKRLDTLIETNSIQEAIDLSQKIYDWSYDWSDETEYVPTIIIDGIIELDKPIGEDSLITVGKNDSEVYIKICGYEENTEDRSDAIKYVGTQDCRIFMIEKNSGLYLNNLTLEGGNISNGNGGAIYCKGSVSTEQVTIKNCKATYGGGIYSQGTLYEDRNYIDYAGLGLYNTTIEYCESKNSGAGLHLAEYSDLHSGEGLLIQNNKMNLSSASGAGIYIVKSSKMFIKKGKIINNNAPSNGGGICTYTNKGSGVNYNCNLVECEISGNTAGAAGGGIHITSTSFIQLENCIVRNNTCGTTGLDVNIAGTVFLQGNTYIGNSYIASNIGKISLDTSTENKVCPIQGQSICTKLGLYNYLPDNGQTERVALTGTALDQTLCDLFELQDPLYKIDANGKVVSSGLVITECSTWQDLLNGINNLSSVDGQTYEFVITQDMTYNTSPIINTVPVKIKTNGKYTLTKDTNYQGALFMPNADLIIDGSNGNSQEACLTISGSRTNTPDTASLITIDNENSQYVEITNCNFKDKYSSTSGAIINYNINTSLPNPYELNVENCTFTNNDSNSDGGAIYIAGDSNLTTNIKNCNFTKNIATSGGACMFAIELADVTLESCNFSENKCAISGNGGAIYNANYSTIIKGDGTYISGNNKIISGSTKANDIYYSNYSELTLDNALTIGTIEYGESSDSNTWFGINLGNDFEPSSKITISFSSKKPSGDTNYLFKSQKDISFLLSASNKKIQLDSSVSGKTLTLTSDNQKIYLN